MQAPQSPDALDAPLVYRTYAVCVGLGGLAVILWGKTPPVQFLGAVAIAAGCCAAALAMVEDLEARYRSLLWFAAAHLAILCVVAFQGKAVWGESTADWLAGIVLSISLAFVFFYFGYWGMAQFGTFPPWGAPSPYEKQIRELAAQEERNRLARDLHDSIKQQVFVIQTAAATAQTRFDNDPDGARQAMQQVRDSARGAMTEMEVMLDQLRAEPLENTGLVEALKKQCEALGFRTGASVEFKVGTLPPSTSLAPGAHKALFRVAQEALSNIARHARASHVVVSLDSVGRGIQLSVQDDGAGFDPNRAGDGMGRANMRARAEEFGGEFELWSQPGRGTSIQVSIPYTVVDSRKFRWQAMIWGVVAVAFVVGFVWTRRANALGVILVVMAFARYLTAWLRTRRRSEATR